MNAALRWVDNDWARLFGDAVVAALWQGALIAGVAAILLILFRRASAAWRHAVAFGGLLAMAVVPVASLASHRVKFKAAPTVLPVLSGSAMNQGTGSSAAEPKSAAPSAPQAALAKAPAATDSVTAVRRGSASPKWTVQRIRRGVQRRIPLLGAAWVVGVGLLGAWQLVGIGFALSLKRRGVSPATAASMDLLGSIQKRAGWKKAVRLLRSARISGPVAIGWLKPVILLPVGLACQMPAGQLEALLAHELAHLRRHDPWLALVQGLLETVLFFHPAAWWLGRVIRQEREHICDDLAAEWCGDRRMLAEALGSLAAGSWSGLAFQSRGGTLVKRVRRLLLPPPVNASGRLPLGPLIFLTMALTAAVFAMSKGRAAANVTAVDVVRGKIFDRSGVVLAETAPDGSRRYPLKALAPHVVGWVGPDRKSKGTKRLGIEGVEHTHESELSGGHSVQLALDARLQAMVENALRDAKVGRGAAVVLDPRNGEVLAMASVPSFDPQAFVPKIGDEAWRVLRDDPTGPMLNRAVAPQVPGSTFKLVTSLAAIDAGLGDEHHTCTGRVSVDGRDFQCWSIAKGFEHGDLDLPGGLENSCNCYFYAVGVKIGSQRLCDMAGRLGIGCRTGIDLRSDPPGRFSPSGPEEARHPWNDSMVANVAIGQGFTFVSPLQMAVVTAAVANGGDVWVPRLAIAVDGKPLPPKLRSHLFEDGRAAKIDLIRKGMFRVITGGTGKRAAIQGLEIGGKTGTAQGWRAVDNEKKANDNKGWFVGFVDDPVHPLAFAVMVENGYSGGSTAAPIARQILGQWLRPDDFPSPPLAPLEPAKGHFHEVRDVTFPNGAGGSK